MRDFRLVAVIAALAACVGQEDVAGTLGASARDGDSCAALASGAIRCWGSNQFGKLGLGAGVGDRSTPTIVYSL